GAGQAAHGFTSVERRNPVCVESRRYTSRKEYFRATTPCKAEVVVADKGTNQRLQAPHFHRAVRCRPPEKMKPDQGNHAYRLISDHSPVAAGRLRRRKGRPCGG